MKLKVNECLETRKKVVEVSRRLYNLGFMAGSGGNVSVRVRKTDSEEIFITPSGLCKGKLKISDILRVDLESNVVEGNLKPTSETFMHNAVYKRRKDVNAVVHAHPPVCTGFASARVPLDYSVDPEIIVMVGEIPLVEYVTPTTKELAEKVGQYAAEYNALLLANHGSVTLGANLEQAYQRTEQLEHLAKILLVSKLLGGSVALPKAEIQKLKGFKVTEPCTKLKDN